MKHTIATALVALGVISTTAGAETLEEVYRQAQQNDHQFKAAKAEFMAGREDLTIGRAGLLPRISAGYQWLDEEQDSEGFREVLGEGTLDIDSTSESTRSGYSLTLTQPLFDLSAWHTYKKGKLDRKVAEASFKSEQQALIIRTAEAYFNVLRAIDNFETAKAEENANSHQLEQTRKRFEVGLTAITEVHEAQAAYDGSIARRLLQEGQVGIEFEALEVITGQPYQHLAPLKEKFPIVPPSPVDRASWVEFATENNFSLTAASLQAKAAAQSARSARSAHLPTVTGELSYSDGNSEGLDNLSQASDIDSTTNSVSVTVSMPIFTGGSVSGQRKKAANLALQTKELFYQAQRDTVQQARSLHLSVLTDVATLKARAQAITSNQSALEATQAGYEVGTRDLVDVLQAQRSLFAAQRDYSDALYTYVLNTLRLKQVAGILTEEDVVQLDSWLDSNKKVSRLHNSELIK